MKKGIKYHMILLALMLFFSSCNNTQEKENSDAKNMNTEAIRISDINNEASCVYLTQDEKQVPVISWVEVDSIKNKHFYFSHWNNEKSSFDKTTHVPIPANTSVHEEGMPKVAFKADGTIIAIFETSTPVPNSRFGQGDIQYIESTDRGVTWTEPKSIYKNRPKDASISFSGITSLNNGEIGVAWLGTSNSTTEGRPVQFAQTKIGEGFQAPILIDKMACECCRVAIASDNLGGISIAYRDLLAGSIRDISISNSYNNGDKFENLEGISDDQWEVAGCPHNGPSIYRDGDTTYLAWATGGEKPGVHYAEYDRDGKESNRKSINSNGRFIQLSALPNGTIIYAYNEDYKLENSFYTRVRVGKIDDEQHLEKEVTFPKSESGYPVLKAIDDQNIIVAWQEDNQSIFYKHILVTQINEPYRM